MNTNEKGNVGLAKVILDVINNGYFPFLPFSDTTNVDLVIGNSKLELKRLQIKYISLNKNGVLEISTSSIVNGKRIPVNLTFIDIWAIYCPNNDKIYYISSTELINKKRLCLRVIKSKQIQSTIHYADDYLNIKKALN